MLAAAAAQSPVQVMLNAARGLPLGADVVLARVEREGPREVGDSLLVASGRRRSVS